MTGVWRCADLVRGGVHLLRLLPEGGRRRLQPRHVHPPGRPSPRTVRAPNCSFLRSRLEWLRSRLRLEWRLHRHVNYACEWVGGKYVPQENVRQSASGPIAVKPGTVVNPMRADAQEFI